MFRALLREPLSVFALIGALLFGVYVYLDDRASPPVTLAAETRAALVGAFEQLTGRAATPEEIRNHYRQYSQRRAREQCRGGVVPIDPGDAYGLALKRFRDFEDDLRRRKQAAASVP
jgi:hypothetical protein